MPTTVCSTQPPSRKNPYTQGRRSERESLSDAQRDQEAHDSRREEIPVRRNRVPEAGFYPASPAGP